MVNNTEKNEQQAIHYPFSGFYRKLLPTAETDTTEEQTAQVAPMPAPADDTPQNATGATERAPRWVADVIGEDYKTLVLLQMLFTTASSAKTYGSVPC